jgi:hypothetical protein
MTFEETKENWNTLLEYVDKYISSPRKEKLISFYETLSERITTAPASSHITRHRCEPGGYIDHVNRVVKCALKLYEVWKTSGANTSNFSVEELVFSALNHDLGKIGSEKEEYYIPNDSDWHVKRGQIYKINPVLQFMKVPDRSIFLLQSNNIEISENEYLAIKLHDGLYGKGNESYLMAAMPEFALKTDLPILLHHSDHLATLIEANLKHSKEQTADTELKAKTKMNKVNDPIVDDNLKNAFKELFG